MSVFIRGTVAQYWLYNPTGIHISYGRDPRTTLYREGKKEIVGAALEFERLQQHDLGSKHTELYSSN